MIYVFNRNKVTHLNFPFVLSILANCILLLVTSNGYETHWASAPDNPPHNSFAGKVSTIPPVKKKKKHFNS